MSTTMWDVLIVASPLILIALVSVGLLVYLMKDEQKRKEK